MLALLAARERQQEFGRRRAESRVRKMLSATPTSRARQSRKPRKSRPKMQGRGVAQMPRHPLQHNASRYFVTPPIFLLLRVGQA